MVRFLFVRLLQSVITLLGVTFLSFLIIKMAPGDYLDQLRLNPQISPETIELLKKQYGLDKPLSVQYLKWLKSAITFDLGYSFQYHAPVLELIKERIGNTLLLTLSSAIISWFFALTLGFLAGFREGTWIDRLIKAYAYTFMSFPSFFLAFILLLIVSKTGILPVGGMHSAGFERMSLSERTLDLLKHMVVPVLTLSLVSTASMVRLVRSSVIEVLSSPMVLFLKAKGLPKKVMIKHVFKNVMNPFTTLIGYEIAGLLSGAALIEIIVGWPGLGTLMLDAVLSQDLFLVMGGLYIGTIMLLLGNLIADILLAVLDPRIRERELISK
ncbi:ABC transporter permease [Hydrogenobacter hydrogenophilus]|uniref:Peptide/nickel transport system permease protein n=1 Tax=Hydrogenobacter hydrogenophilus TaxID=35835 RepID=A0A285NWV3_9AQUI|nr:ABC transporter permease [Hydrogenobacter hydrogenophilus]SNZ13972.1 peptide/nickel transport system permease protein [Hydrogenobacter hydrogenophilus]